jgi:hypothetical protein
MKNILWFQIIIRKQVPTNNFHEKFLGRKLFMVAKLLPRKQIPTKNYHENVVKYAL